MQIQINKLNNSLILLDKEQTRIKLSNLSSVLLCIAGLLGMSDVLLGKEPIDALFLLNAFLLVAGIALTLLANYKKSNTGEIPLKDIEALILKDGAAPVYTLKLSNGKHRVLSDLKDLSSIEKMKNLLQKANIPIVKED